MKLFKKYKQVYSEMSDNLKKYIIFLLIGNTFSISGIFIETYGTFGLLGLFIILIGFTKFGGVHHSHIKFYRRKLSKHKIWIKIYKPDDRINYIWKPLDKSFYIDSENCSGCYTINPLEVFNHYGKNDQEFDFMVHMLSNNRDITENSYICSYFDSKYIIEYSKKDIHIIGNRDKCIDELLVS